MLYSAPPKNDVKDILEFRIKTLADARRIMPEVLTKGKSVYATLTETLMDLCLTMCNEGILEKTLRNSTIDFTGYRFKYDTSHFLYSGGDDVLNLLGIRVEHTSYFFCEIDFYRKEDPRNTLRLWYRSSYDDDPRKILSNRGDGEWDGSFNEYLRIISLIEALTKIRYLAKLSKVEVKK